MKTSCSMISAANLNRRHFLAGTVLLPLVACMPLKEMVSPEIKELAGNVFGSTYNIKFTGNLDVQVWKTFVESFFSEFDREFSTYRKDSMISQLNEIGPDKQLEVSARFVEMLELSKNLNSLTAGALDPTVGPLIEVWGSGKAPIKTPTKEMIAGAKARTGIQHLKWNGKQVWKTLNGLKLNVNSFAPGWAADLLGMELSKRGINNYMIDIGGEILVKGKKADNSPWVIGIEEPTQKLEHRIRSAVKITDASISTSGSYRQFFLENGKRRPHIIDPRSGTPVDNGITSVTVIARSAVEADAWGTALMVLGEEGIPLAEKNGIKVLLLKGSEEKLTQVVSPDMKIYLAANQMPGR